MNLGIYLVTDKQLCGQRGVAETVKQAVDAGAQTVQLRNKAATFEEHLKEVEQLANVIDGRAILVVNDRLDVVIEARKRGIKVDGVHLGQGDEAVNIARAELGPNAIVGLTANTNEHLQKVREMPEGTVDYLGIGVIRPTSTKPNHPPALGIEGFRQLVENSPVPAVAIGGITFGDIGNLRRAGAQGVAIVSAICAAESAESATQEFVAEWNAGAVVI